MRQLRWPLDGFAAAARVPAPESPGKARALRTRYPIRYLRYWFVRSLLSELHARLGRRLSVLEVGIDRGQMLSFMGGEAQDGHGLVLPKEIERWDGLDVNIDAEQLTRLGYTDFFAADIEKPHDFGSRRYDAIILLHVLEHLEGPEAAMARLLDILNAGGALMGGSPTMPEWLARTHQRMLQRKFADRLHDVHAHRHLSVITPARLSRFARSQALAMDLLTGTFFMRVSGLPLENSATWLRANLLWGALFPSLGGEVYFSFRKPAG